MRKQPAGPGKSADVEPVHLELGDETFIAADRALVAAIVADPERCAQWWPDLRLKLLRDRGEKGCQWVVSSAEPPVLGGTVEIYLEPWHDGTLLHRFVRLELSAGRSPGRQLRRMGGERTLSWKRTVARLKDELELGRAPGMAARAAQVGRPK